MEWTFLIAAGYRARVASRVLQVLDQHMFSVLSFSSMRIGEDVRITLVVRTDASGCTRVRALLHKLQDVRSVDCFENSHATCRTVALLKVLCDHESRLPLLQTISSVGAQVLSIQPDFVAFQMVGSAQDVEGIRASLLPYGVVESVSIAAVAVQNRYPMEHDTDSRAEEQEPASTPLRSPATSIDRHPERLRRAAVV